MVQAVMGEGLMLQKQPYYKEGGVPLLQCTKNTLATKPKDTLRKER